MASNNPDDLRVPTIRTENGWIQGVLHAVKLCYRELGRINTAFCLHFSRSVLVVLLALLKRLRLEQSSKFVGQLLSGIKHYEQKLRTNDWHRIRIALGYTVVGSALVLTLMDRPNPKQKTASQPEADYNLYQRVEQAQALTSKPLLPTGENDQSLNSLAKTGFSGNRKSSLLDTASLLTRNCQARSILDQRVSFLVKRKVGASRYEAVVGNETVVVDTSKCKTQFASAGEYFGYIDSVEKQKVLLENGFTSDLNIVVLFEPTKADLIEAYYRTWRLVADCVTASKRIIRDEVLIHELLAMLTSNDDWVQDMVTYPVAGDDHPFRFEINCAKEVLSTLGVDGTEQLADLTDEDTRLLCGHLDKQIGKYLFFLCYPRIHEIKLDLRPYQQNHLVHAFEMVNAEANAEPYATPLEANEYTAWDGVDLSDVPIFSPDGSDLGQYLINRINREIKALEKECLELGHSLKLSKSVDNAFRNAFSRASMPGH